MVKLTTNPCHSLAGPDSPEAMDRAKKVMLWVGWSLSLLLIVIWPLLALPAGVFSKVSFRLL